VRQVGKTKDCQYIRMHGQQNVKKSVFLVYSQQIFEGVGLFLNNPLFVKLYDTKITILFLLRTMSN